MTRDKLCDSLNPWFRQWLMTRATGAISDDLEDLDTDFDIVAEPVAKTQGEGHV